MKYFEIHDPYYALLKAETETEAIEEYTNVVADEDPEQPLEDEIKEVNRDYALVKFGQAPCEDTELLTPSKILEEFNSKGSSVLVIDGSLL